MEAALLLCAAFVAGGTVVAEAEAPFPQVSDVASIIITRSKEFKDSSIYLDFLGRPARAKFVSAGETGLAAEIGGETFDFPWAEIEARRLLDIASRAAKSAEDFILLARYAFSKGDVSAADALLDKALAADPTRESDILKVRNLIRPPPAPKPEIEKPVDAKPAAVSPAPQYPALPLTSWQCLGPGGGGAMYTPTISPHDPKVAIITCDMGGVYMTRDGGRRWRVLPNMHLGHGVAFSSSDPNTVFVGLSGKLYRSRDLGATWEAVTADRQYPTCSAWHVEVDPDDGRYVWVAFGWGGEAGSRVNPANRFLVERSQNGGNAFSDASNGFPKGSGMVKKIAIDRSTPVGARTLYAATSGGFFKSTDAGARWEKTGSGIPRDDLREVVALFDKTANKTTVLVSAEPGGVYRSEDGGATFTRSDSGMGDGAVVEQMAASWVDANIVWAAGSHVWKSTDGGKTWKDAYADATRHAGWLCVFRPWSHDSARGIGCNPKDPNNAWFTGDMQVFATADGGANWTEINGHPMPDGTVRPTFKGPGSWNLYSGAPHFYDGGGLEVTFVYQVMPNPLLPNVFYAGYADIGTFRTEDAGKSWTCNSGKWNTGIKSEWRNSCYEIAVDERKPGRIYGVFSGRHNLPGADITDAGRYNIGGAAVSDNGGKNWTPYEDVGLPDRPCTSIIIDKRSSQENVLYVAVYGVGVYRSTNGGKKWENMSDGLPANARAWRLRQAADNSIWLASTNNNPGGVWKYDDTARQWKRVDTSPRFTDVRDIILGGKGREGFVAVAQSGADGGIFASVDAGASWKKVFSGDMRSVDVTPDGQHWFAGGNGLFRSADGGAKWQRIDDFPFRFINDVTINPKNPGELWVGTAGCGVFKGPGVMPGTP